MLEVKGELVFKTVAYHRAADAIGRSPVDIVAAYRSGTPPRIPGVGAAISDKLAELAKTGHLAFYDRLRAEIPPGLVALLQIPGLGPKSVRQLHIDLKIESIDDLRAAAEAGRLRGLRGMSEKTEALVLEGIDRIESTPKRLLLDKAESIIEDMTAALADTPGRRRPGAGRLVPPQARDDRRPGPPRRDRRRGGPDRAVHRARGRRPRRQPGRLQGGRAADARPAGRPDDHAAGRGGHVPHPLHRVQGAQRPAPRDGPGPGLEPVGEGLPAHRREGRAADRRRRRAAHVPRRDRGLCVPRPAVHRARAARGHRRDRGGPGRPAAEPHRRRTTCAATSTRTPTGPTASTRSR